MSLSKKVLFYLLVWMSSAIYAPVGFCQWGPPFANSWIGYGKSYVKIAISENGLYHLSFTTLPKDFNVTHPELLQLWHRGREVAILSAEKTGLTFYAEKNGGDTDSLLYRPAKSRMNPYYSLFSDESAYFLTVAEKAGKRAGAVSQLPDAKLPVTNVHEQTDVTTFFSDYSLSTAKAPRAHFFNSFYEKGASKTGPSTAGAKRVYYPITLSEPSEWPSGSVTVKVLLHGRSNNDRIINLYAGKDEQSLRLAASVANANFVGSECIFQLNPSDLNMSGKGVLAIDTKSNAAKDSYSLSYYQLTYSRKISGSIGEVLNLYPTNSPWTQLSVPGLKAGSQVLDITDRDEPVILQGAGPSLMVPRTKGMPLRMIIPGTAREIQAEKVKPVPMQPLAPEKYDYIIITHKGLLDVSKEYAAYRSSKAGGSHQALVIDVADLYSQFNYGEPSPVAIKRFISFYLSKRGQKDNYIFLIGKSITYSERMVREMPDEVPTVGFPGSDLLLVDGLDGVPENIPAVPIGRLTAFTNAQVRDYLQKVKEYEGPDGKDLMWRKNVLHVNGGKSTEEVSTMKNMLGGLAPIAMDGSLGANVKAFAKPQGILEPIEVDITPEINAGVGLISYLGHGSTVRMDYNFGYITEPDRQYDVNSKYALMYFNGCSAGNVFSDRQSNSPQPEGSRVPLSLDWLLAPGRGAIAVLANSFESYLSVSANYLHQLYIKLFQEHPGMPIGQIQVEVAKAILKNNTDPSDVANVHQTVLQGDPALRIFALDKPDYSIHPDEGIRLLAPEGEHLGSAKSFKIQLFIENKGRYDSNDKVDVDVFIHFSGGKTEHITRTIPGIRYAETVLFEGIRAGEDLAHIEVILDPQRLSLDGNDANHYSELIVNWPQAGAHPYYPFESVKDLVPPVLSVTFNKRTIQNGEPVGPEPEIELLLRDDRSLLPDGKQFEMSIKSCADPSCPCGENDCEPGKDFADGIQVSRQQLDNRTIRLTLPMTGMAEGTYQLAVRQIKDRSGNMAEPFYIEFRVAPGDESRVSVVVSPNPASRYVKFTAKDYPEGQAVLRIYDKEGNLRHQSNYVTTHTGPTDLYWLPDAAGDYFYRIEWAGGKSHSVGKFIVLR